MALEMAVVVVAAAASASAAVVARFLGRGGPIAPAYPALIIRRAFQGHREAFILLARLEHSPVLSCSVHADASRCQMIDDASTI